MSRAGLARTYKMPHLNVRQFGLFVSGTNGTLSATGVLDAPDQLADADTFTFVVDEAEGLVRIAKAITGGFAGNWVFNFEGYYYEWVSDADLRYFANNIVAEHAFHRSDFTLERVSDAEEDVISLGAAVECLWSLMIEYARDIDINAPSGVPVPASQRFRQVEALLMGPLGLIEKYKQKANLLGVGLDRMEMLTLRRVSYQTNRLVPVYKPREWDDKSLPERQFTSIDSSGTTAPPPGFHRYTTVQGFYDGSGGGSAVPEP
jgi:hypothetical protein